MDGQLERPVHDADAQLTSRIVVLPIRYGSFDLTQDCLLAETVEHHLQATEVELLLLARYNDVRFLEDVARKLAIAAS